MSAQIATREPENLHQPETSPQLAQLEHNLGFPEHAHGLYEELQHRCGSLFSDAHYIHGLPTARFAHLPCARHSVVSAVDGELLAANHLQLSPQQRLISGQYPRTEQLENHFHTLLQQQTPLLLIIASGQEIQDMRLPAYFHQDAHYGSIQVSSRRGLPVILPQGLLLENHQLTVTGPDRSTTLEIIRINHWQPELPLASATLLSLVRIISQRSQQFPGQAPWLHGVEGIGRSAVLAAAMGLLAPEARSLEAIITSLRIDRNPGMISTPQQLALLAELATTLDIPLLDQDADQSTRRTCETKKSDRLSVKSDF